MKAKTLISKLQKLDPNTEVICSSDMEGNNISKLAVVTRCLFKENKSQDRSIDYFDRSIELYDMQDEEAPRGAKNCIVLWPQN